MYRRMFPLIVARMLPRLSSWSMAFRFVGSLCECICLCLFVVLLYTCFHTHTPGLHKAPGQCFVHGHSTKTQDVDTFFGSENIKEDVSLLGKCVDVADVYKFRVWAFQENGST